jgi:hypothetical protein
MSPQKAFSHHEDAEDSRVQLCLKGALEALKGMAISLPEGPMPALVYAGLLCEFRKEWDWLWTSGIVWVCWW